MSSAEDAYDKIRAGASLIELYTALGKICFVLNLE